MKTIILYYSRTGKTAEAAKTLTKELEADIIEIKDLKSRNSALNYINASVDAFRENKTKISPSSVDLSPLRPDICGNSSMGRESFASYNLAYR